ncbi:MAG: hypothetical protein JWQ51_3104 [Tardiphaga sp.]|nr:hypothetical protein [Tardiphaga sp.]
MGVLSFVRMSLIADVPQRLPYHALPRHRLEGWKKEKSRGL